MLFKSFFVLISFLSSSSVAIACSCDDPSVRQKYREADAVFVGEVISFKTWDNPVNKYFFYKVDFRVERQWKGKKQKVISAVASYDQPGMCNDLSLNVGEKFLIYTPLKKKQYIIYRECGPNRNAKSAKKEIKKVGSFWRRLFYDLFPYPKFN